MITARYLALFSFVFNSFSSVYPQNTDSFDAVVNDGAENLQNHDFSHARLSKAMETFNFKDIMHSALVAKGMTNEKKKVVYPKIQNPKNKDLGDIQNQYWYNCYMVCEGCVNCGNCLTNCFNMFLKFFSNAKDYDLLPMGADNKEDYDPIEDDDGTSLIADSGYKRPQGKTLDSNYEDEDDTGNYEIARILGPFFKKVEGVDDDMSYGDDDKYDDSSEYDYTDDSE